MVGVPQQAVHEVTRGAVLAQVPAGVPEAALEEGEPAQLLHVLDRIGQQPGGEDHQHHADDAEEQGQVEASPELEDDVGDAQGQRQAEYGAEQQPVAPGRRRRLGRRGEDDGQCEHHGLDPLPSHRLEGQYAQPEAGLAVECLVGPALEVGGHGPAVRLHPERHVGQDHRGQQVGDGLEDGLDPRAVVLLDDQIGGDAAPEDERHGRTHAQEDVPEVPALADLVQVGEQDGHDHARLDALPEEDDEGGNHRGAPLRSYIVQMLGKPNFGAMSTLSPTSARDQHGMGGGWAPDQTARTTTEPNETSRSSAPRSWTATRTSVRPDGPPSTRQRASTGPTRTGRR